MLTVVDQVTDAGSPARANEDVAGAAGSWAWVIDGFIFSDHPPALDERSDATWFTAFVGDRLKILAPSAEDGAELLRRAVAEARAVFLSAIPAGRREDPASWPGAALTLARVRDGEVVTWNFSDTVAYLADGNEVTVLGEAAALRKAESAAASQLMAQSGTTCETIRSHPEFRAWIRRGRERQVAGQGGPVLSLQPDGAERAIVRRAPARSGSTLLLASDGFSALAELYERFDPAGLVEGALATGLKPLVAELRRIENEVDPDGARFPRFKRSDDATAILLRVQ